MRKSLSGWVSGLVKPDYNPLWPMIDTQYQQETKQNKKPKIFDIFLTQIPFVVSL
jgi:DNA transposition AAA+ family ATPase